MRSGAKETIKGFLKMAEDRMSLARLDDSDLEKVLEHIEKAEEEIEKELDKE